MATPQPLKVLYSIHDNVEALDFTGPLEFLCHAEFPSSPGTKVFIPTIVSESELTSSGQHVQFKRHHPTSEIYKSLSDYDILIIPGGGSTGVLDGKTEPLNLIKAFASLPPKPNKNDALKGERILLSVCTGSLFLAEAGVLGGLSATTHFEYYDKFKEILSTKEGETKVLDERFVVNPLDEEKGLRVVTCGGVSCGLDGSLWVIEHVVGKEVKERVAKIIQYAPREGVVL